MSQKLSRERTVTKQDVYKTSFIFKAELAPGPHIQGVPGNEDEESVSGHKARSGGNCA